MTIIRENSNAIILLLALGVLVGGFALAIVAAYIESRKK